MKKVITLPVGAHRTIKCIELLKIFYSASMKHCAVLLECFSCIFPFSFLCDRLIFGFGSFENTDTHAHEHTTPNTSTHSLAHSHSLLCCDVSLPHSHIHVHIHAKVDAHTLIAESPPRRRKNTDNNNKNSDDDDDRRRSTKDRQWSKDEDLRTRRRRHHRGSKTKEKSRTIGVRAGTVHRHRCSRHF